MRPKVIFIGSHDRSGSTILDLYLNELSDFFSVGEFRHFTRAEGFSSRQLCGCGVAIAKCDFWNTTIDKTKFGKSTQDKLVSLRPQVDRFRYIRKYLSFDKADSTFRKSFSNYSDVLADTFSNILEVSGCQFIIDSSKVPSYGFALSKNPNIDFYYVHLVRDARAVAHSMSKVKKRPEITWDNQYLMRYNSVQASVSWNVRNYALDALRKSAQNSILIRYEDFVVDPQNALKKVLDLIGFDENTSLNNTKNINSARHMINGNPMRFDKGTISIRPDFSWKQKISGLSNGIVTTMTFPLLKKYDYV